MWILLLLSVALAQTTTSCAPACADNQKCVECNGKTQCISEINVFTCVTTPPACNSTCNGVPPPRESTTCWDGTGTRSICDLGKCAWVSSLCPVNPCEPSPCKPTDKCCVLGEKKVCSTSVPPPRGAAYVCIPPAPCECDANAAPATTAASVCFDGSLAGLYCNQDSATTCSWKVRTCPTNPCEGNPCANTPATPVCTINAVILGGTVSGAAYTCIADPCTGVTCAGKGICKNGACYCALSIRDTTAQTQCSDGSLTPVFNNDVKVCDWVTKTCPPLPPPPTCTNGEVLVNTATKPICVLPTDPCAAITCSRGLTCVVDGLKGVCKCLGCPKTDVAISLCYTSKPAQICNLETCQYVPNPDCSIPDPCTTIKCPDGTSCMNTGTGIAAGPICVARQPCNPNPCTDPKTVCRATVKIASTTTVSGASVLGEAKAYECVPMADPEPTTCKADTCHNGGVCGATSHFVCQCQTGWKGKFCTEIDCAACLISKQCRTSFPVLSSDGTNVKESCVCSDVRFTGAACTTVVSGDGKTSPEVAVATREGTEGIKASIAGAEGTSFQIKGGRLDAASVSKFNGDPIVVEIDRLDATGKSVPGELGKGVYANITLCSSTFVSTKEPEFFLVDSDLKKNKEICASINTGATIRSATFAAPNCWTFPVCHASTYAAGTPGSTNGAQALGVSMVAFVMVLFAL